MSNGLKVTLIILLSVLVIAITGGLILLINSNFQFNFIEIRNSMLSKTLVEEKEIDNIKALDLSANYADIYILDEERDTIKVELYSDNVKEHSITDEENAITVKFDNTKSFGLFKKTPSMKIYLPKNYSDKIEIDSKVGDIEIGDFENSIANIKASVGDTKIKSIKSVKIIASTGDIKIENVNDLEAKLTTGDIKVENAKKVISEVRTGDIKVANVNELTAKITTGDVKVQNVENSLDISSKTGDVKVMNATVNKNSKISSGVGDVKVNNLNGAYVEAKTNIGDVRVNNNKNRKSDIILKITSRVGDIRVN